MSSQFKVSENVIKICAERQDDDDDDDETLVLFPADAGWVRRLFIYRQNW